jgi:hypothetical protein
MAFKGDDKPRVSIAALQRDRPRRCTDVLFLVLFLLSLATAGYSSVYAAERGSLDRIIYGQVPLCPPGHLTGVRGRRGSPPRPSTAAHRRSGLHG